MLLKIEGLHFKKRDDGIMDITIKADVLIAFLNKHVNSRGFVDGIITPREKQTEKVTHIAHAKINEQQKTDV